MILSAVEKQVGGVAEATGLSSAKLSNAFGQITDEIGAQFLPMMDRMVKWFQSSEGKKAIQVWIDKINEIGAYFNSPEFAAGLDQWVKRIEGLLKFIGTLLDGLNEFLNTVVGNSSAKQQFEKRMEDNRRRQEEEWKFQSSPENQAWGKQNSANQRELYYAMQKSKSTPTVVNQNITVNAPNVDGKAVVDAVKKQAQRQGTSVFSLFGFR
jgi:hypothetical protein